MNFYSASSLRLERTMVAHFGEQLVQLIEQAIRVSRRGQTLIAGLGQRLFTVVRASSRAFCIISVSLTISSAGARFIQHARRFGFGVCHRALGALLRRAKDAVRARVGILQLIFRTRVGGFQSAFLPPWRPRKMFSCSR